MLVTDLKAHLIACQKRGNSDTNDESEEFLQIVDNSSSPMFFKPGGEPSRNDCNKEVSSRDIPAFL